MNRSRRPGFAFGASSSATGESAPARHSFQLFRRAVEALNAALQDSAAPVRKNAAWALRLIRIKSGELRPEELSKIGADADRDEDPDVDDVNLDVNLDVNVDVKKP